MGKPIPKQFIILAGKPIIAHVLEKVEQLRDVERSSSPARRSTSTRRETLLGTATLGPLLLHRRRRDPAGVRVQGSSSSRAAIV